MSLVLLANTCSHLQNASKARLGLTSILQTKMNLAVALSLQREGFVSSITRGSTAGPDDRPTPTTRDNVSTRRLWLELKYYDNEPVMRKLQLISRPKQRMWLKVEDLHEVAMGRRAKYVDGLQPGECILVSTDKGILDLREAVKRHTGGQPLLRVS